MYWNRKPGKWRKTTLAVPGKYNKSLNFADIWWLDKELEKIKNPISYKQAIRCSNCKAIAKAQIIETNNNTSYFCKNCAIPIYKNLRANSRVIVKVNHWWKSNTPKN